MDELTMFASLRPDSEVLSADERATLRVSLFGSSADGSRDEPALDAPPSIADVPESTLTDLEPTRPQAGPRRRSRRVTHGLLAIAVAAAVVTTLVLISRDDTTAPADTPIPITNGWIAFASSSPEDVSTATDIYLVREGSNPRRITGSDTDLTNEICPAFSPDGTRLAFGQSTGDSDHGDPGDGTLVITDLSADGVRTATTTIALEGATHPPCAIWSADGRWLAFGVDTSAGESDGESDQVWVVDTESDDIRRLAGLFANDLDWAPHATELAIALNDENVRSLAGDGVVVYSVTADETRPLGATGAETVAWSPDGRTIAYRTRTSPNLPDESVEFWLMEADGTHERLLVPEVDAMQGRGPVWSPDGERIAYQRRCARNPSGFTAACLEETEVVLLTVNADDPREPAGTEVVIPPPQTTGPGGQPMWWFPYSVTWSPDGTALLYYAWTEATDLTITRTTPNGIVAVSVDGDTPPVVLSGDLGADPFSGSPWLPAQSWGRQQGG